MQDNLEIGTMYHNSGAIYPLAEKVIKIRGKRDNLQQEQCFLQK
jgi:hypothetical protein